MRPAARSSPSPSAAQKRASKSASASAPFSRSKRRSRAAESRRNASRTASGVSPSAAQNSANESKTLVVSTPPQSMSSPARASGTERHRLGATGELEHAVPERLEERVVGRPADRALVVALHEDDRLPEGEHGVPADVGHRPPAALLVAGDELGAGRKAL